MANALVVSGTISGAQNLTIGGNWCFHFFRDWDTYSGVTTVGNGGLFVNGRLSGPSAVNVTGTGAGSVAVLGGNGTIVAPVTVQGAGALGTNEITGGTPASNGTLTLTGGLTINTGGIAFFGNVATDTSGNFINITGGVLTISNGAIVEVPTALAAGTYDLIGGASGISTSNFVIDNTSGGAATSNYSLQLISGTLQLVVTAVTTPQPTLTISNGRAMAGQSVTLTGTVSNVSGGSALNGTLADNGGAVTITGFSPSNPTPAAGASTSYTATVSNVGATLGNNSVKDIVTDPTPVSATASGTVSVLQNRIVNASAVSFGLVHAGAYSATTTLTSAGDDSMNTRVSVGDSATPDANGVTVTGGNVTGTFNGLFSDSRTVSGNLATGANNGTITLTTSGEGLAGESDVNVAVTYSGTAFSGKASWSGTGGGTSWGTNTNWGDTQAPNLTGAGAPGISGAYSNGDTATFGDFTGETATTSVTLDGVSPSLLGITFNAASTSYTIAPGTGGNITLQNGATITLASGTGTISTSLAGINGFTTSGTGTLILSGNNTFTGGVTMNGGAVVLASAGAFNSTTANNLTFGSNVAAGTIFEINGNNVTIGSLNTNAVTAGFPIIENNATTSGTLNITTGGTYAGVIQNGGAGLFSLNMKGTLLSLSGANTYTGSTILTTGTLNLASGGALGTTGGILFAGGVLQYSASNTTDYSSRFSATTNTAYTIDTNGQNVTLGTALTNTAGTNGLTKNGTGQLTLSAASTYTGVTTINNGVLQTSGTNLLANTSSPALVLADPASRVAGGVWQPVLSGPTTLNITLGGGAGNVNWSGGGFAAFGGPLTITANAGAQLSFGAGDFGGTGGNGITFGSSTSNNQVILTNSINLNTTDSFQQSIVVNGVTAGSSVLLSGQITQPADSITVNNTEASGIIKSGLGTLILSNTTSNFSGLVIVDQGTLVAGGNSIGTGGGVFGTGTGSPNGTSTTPAAAFAINLGDGSTGAAGNPSLLIGGAYQVDRNVTVTNNGAGNTYSIGGSTDASGTFSGIISVATVAANTNTFQVTQVATTGADALNITGQITGVGGSVVNFNNVGAVNVSGSINGAGFAVTQMGSGTPTLSGSNSYSGATTIQQGNLSVTNSVGSATGSGQVSVTANLGAVATLSGNGIISGNVVTSATSATVGVAHIAPGVNTSGSHNNFGTAGTLSLGGGLTIGAGTNLDYDLGTSSDLINVTGALSLGNNVVLNRQ